jgi:hypothetical protein
MLPTMPTQRPGSWAALMSLARTQGGLFTRDDARGCGVAAQDLRRLVARGHAREATPGVFTASSTPDSMSLLERAALLGAGPDAALAEESAGAFWRLCRQPKTVTIELPCGQFPAPMPGVVLRRTRHPSRVPVPDGRLVTPPVRTLVALGRIWPRERLGAAFLDAFQRDLCTSDDVARERELLRGRPGTGLVKDVLSEYLPEFESVLGMEGIWLLRRSGLRVETGIDVIDARGRQRRPDALVVDDGGRHLLDVEFDGWAFHGTKDQQQNDRIRDRALLAVGLPTVRLTTHDVRNQPAATVRDVEATLRSLAERRRPA